MNDTTIIHKKGYTLKSEVLYDADNKPITIWRKVKEMAPVPRELLETIFYVYPTPESAKNNGRDGGTGFFVIHNESVYAVTNRHIVRDYGAVAIRMNNREGSIEILDIGSADWKFHNDNETDIAIARIDTEKLKNANYRRINSNTFLSKEIFEEIEFGLGNNVYMIGRFVPQGGEGFNTPSIREGTISQLPIEGQPIRVNNNKQEAFLVNMESIPGFSGSPVVYKQHIFTNKEYRKYDIGDFDQETMPNWLWLVGIDAGHFRYQAIDRNPGMSAVVVAWKILEVLNQIEESS